MDTTSTIVAPATPLAPGQRAVIRLSGHNAYDAIDAIAAQRVPRSRGVGGLRLRLSGGELPVLAVRLTGPASYTGEDTVELLAPGSTTLVGMIVRRLLDVPGVRHAEAGEFTARAYLNGRLTLGQAEGVAAAIAAGTRSQLEASRRLLEGQTGQRYAALVDELASSLALVEAAADFAEEEHVVPISAGELRDRLDAMIDALGSELEGRRGREHASARPLLVLAGPPNAGKTSLFNALLGRSRSVVSAIEHATRDAVVEPLELRHPALGTITCELADLPGLPTRGVVALDAHERESVGSVIDDALARADVLLLCDPSGDFDWSHPGTATIRLRTKADDPSTTAADALIVSAKTGLNLDTLRLLLAESIHESRQDAQVGLVPRHAMLATRARDALATARAAVQDDPPRHPPRRGELVAAEMRLALDAMGELGGAVSPDEVLGRIFASFCVGK